MVSQACELCIARAKLRYYLTNYKPFKIFEFKVWWNKYLVYDTIKAMLFEIYLKMKIFILEW